MDEVRSKDGTAIAFERSGEGPPVVLVIGAFNDRATGAPLAAALKERFTVFNVCELPLIGLLRSSATMPE